MSKVFKAQQHSAEQHFMGQIELVSQNSKKTGTLCCAKCCYAVYQSGQHSIKTLQILTSILRHSPHNSKLKWFQN